MEVVKYLVKRLLGSSREGEVHANDDHALRLASGSGCLVGEGAEDMGRWDGSRRMVTWKWLVEKGGRHT